MAIFHLSFKVLTRTTKTGKSKSSLYLAAYNSREKLKDELTGLTFDYTKKMTYIKAVLFYQKMPLVNFMIGLHYGKIVRHQKHAGTVRSAGTLSWPCHKSKTASKTRRY